MATLKELQAKYGSSYKHAADPECYACQGAGEYKEPGVTEFTQCLCTYMPHELTRKIAKISHILAKAAIDEIFKA